MQKYYQRKTFRDEGHAWVTIWLDHSVRQEGKVDVIVKVDVSVKMNTFDQNICILQISLKLTGRLQWSCSPEDSTSLPR